ncbi:MAG: hypothetical protein RLO80_00065 [Hyphomonas sp.]
MLRLTASALVLALAACAPAAAPSHEDAAPDAEVPAVEPAASVDATTQAEIPKRADLTYTNTSDSSEVSFDVDPAILAFDEGLAAKIWVEAKVQVLEFSNMADSDRRSADEAAAGSGGESWFRTYSLDVTHRATAAQADFISVQHTVSQYTGGAHPNYFIGGSIYKRGQTDPLPLSAIIADSAAFEQQVINGIVDQKLARGYEETRPVLASSVSEMLAPSAAIPNIYEGRFVLEESTEAGKFGGLSVLFSPYDVGSYAEGAYTVTLSAADLAPILTPEWAGKFGGEPVVAE